MRTQTFFCADDTMIKILQHWVGQREGCGGFCVFPAADLGSKLLTKVHNHGGKKTPILLKHWSGCVLPDSISCRKVFAGLSVGASISPIMTGQYTIEMLHTWIADSKLFPHKHILAQPTRVWGSNQSLSFFFLTQLLCFVYIFFFQMW